MDDLYVLRELAVDIPDGSDGGPQGVSLVVVVKGVEKRSVLPYKGRLCGGGTGIDARNALPLYVARSFTGTWCFAWREMNALYSASEAKRGSILSTSIPSGSSWPDAPAAPGWEQPVPLWSSERIRWLQKDVSGLERWCAHRPDSACGRKHPGADPGSARGRPEMPHVPGWFSAGQSADGLVDNSLEDGGGQIFPGGTFIDQRLDVRLGKHAAAGSDGVEGLVILCVFVETGASVWSREAIWSMKEPVPPAHTPFIRCSMLPPSK